METNGRNLCTVNSSHIDIKYFFLKGGVDKDEIKIQYCHTYLMLEGYFANPLQG